MTIIRCVASLLLLQPVVHATERVPFPFITMIAHWDAYGDPGYLDFVSACRPDVAQVGFYGGHYWSLAHTPQFSGYPAHFPVQGLTECGAWFASLNAELHKRGVKVVGHFNMKFLVGDPESESGPRGFFKFYRELWDETLLGPKPAEDPVTLLEMDASGKPIVQHTYNIGGMAEYWACFNNPHWKSVLKAWVRRAVQLGVDGFMVNYFYRHNCLCRYCQDSFRAYLRERFSAEQLRSNFGIERIDVHRFDEIVCWHDPAASTPLRREMLRFSQIHNKRAFDEVFVEYGRALKPDLILAQWNHIGDFGQIATDERCMLPAALWGKEEDYLWYSTGGANNFTDLASGFLGDSTLLARYIRGAFADKPFTIGKYENTRIRAAIAELAANGGAPMGFYTRFTDPAAREEIVRYYGFLKRYEPLYRGNTPHGEAVLLFPRRRVHGEADVRSVEAFKQLGNELLERHVLLDVLPDDLATPQHLAGYRHAWSVDVPQPKDPENLADFSRFHAPRSVRVAASRPAAGNELTLHFVNYRRQEPAERRSPGMGIQDEKPMSVTGIHANVVLPAGLRVTGLEAMTPEAPDAVSLPIDLRDGRVRFAVPEFLVYCVVRVRLSDP